MKIKKIKDKASSNHSYSSRNIYISESDSDSSLSGDSEWEELIHPTECNETNNLDHVVTFNIENNKNQHNYVIEYLPKFGNTFSLYIGTKDPIQLVTASLRREKKQRITMIAILTFLWYRRATDSMTKRWPTKHYERNIHYNKMGYSKSTGTYFIARDTKVPFSMP